MPEELYSSVEFQTECVVTWHVPLRSDFLREELQRLPDVRELLLSDDDNPAADCHAPTKRREMSGTGSSADSIHWQEMRCRRTMQSGHADDCQHRVPWQ